MGKNVKMSFLVQSIFIVPAMQHGCRAKPLIGWFGGLGLLKQQGVNFNV